MTARYNPAGHPRLTTEARALSPDVLSALAEEAESVLGIADVLATGRAARELTIAVVRQVNWAVRLDAAGGGLYRSESKGDQSYTLNTADGERIDAVDPVALAIVRRVLEEYKPQGGAWPLAGSLR